MNIDARGMHYKLLNEKIHAAIHQGEQKIELIHVNGQRYIGDGLQAAVTIRIQGVPGNDLGAFMDGPAIYTDGNAQDGVANTMSGGKIIIPGHAGDVLGYAMRGGKVFVRGHVGYRTGIHMKEYGEQRPVIVIGGCAGDFFGEYMAGGCLILLGLDRKPHEPLVGNYCGTGIHGGAIFIRGEPDRYWLDKEARIADPDEADQSMLRQVLTEYCSDFGLDVEEILSASFLKLYPSSVRPYGRLYAY